MQSSDVGLIAGQQRWPRRQSRLLRQGWGATIKRTTDRSSGGGQRPRLNLLNGLRPGRPKLFPKPPPRLPGSVFMAGERQRFVREAIAGQQSVPKEQSRLEKHGVGLWPKGKVAAARLKLAGQR